MEVNVLAEARTGKRSPQVLRALAQSATFELAGASAVELLEWTAQTFPGNAVATQSMANTALTTLIESFTPQIPVLFVDTGYHFEETLETRDRIATRVEVLTISSALTIAEQAERFGADLWNSDPDRCCAMRKVAPLTDLLSGKEAWVSGLRRSTATTRVDWQPIAYDDAKDVVKVSPLLLWTDDELAAFTAEHDVITNPLLDSGYPSIGCAPCTRHVNPGEDQRAGRWSGFDKTECGIHR